MGSKEAIEDISASVGRCCQLGEIVCVCNPSIPSWGMNVLSNTMALPLDISGEDIMSLCVGDILAEQ